MTLIESLLPKLSDWLPAGAGRHSWSESFPAEGWTVGITADKADSLSCLVWEMTLQRTADAPVGLTLKTWAAAIIERVSGLLEPLKIYEVDETRNEAILRSDEPTRKGAALAYYEVRLVGLALATVRRFSSTRIAPTRSQVAFAITHEALAKLASDIAS